MIEKEFKELAVMTEGDRVKKKEISSFAKMITDLLYKSKGVQWGTEIKPLGEVISGDGKEITIYLDVSLREKTLPKKLLLKAAFNETENTVLLKLKNNLIGDLSTEIFTRDEEKHRLLFYNGDRKISFVYYFRKDSLMEKTENRFLSERFLTENEYFDSYRNKYPRFENTINIIRYFLKLLNSNTEAELLSYLLIYGLEKYNNKTDDEYDNSYVGYLKAFVSGIEDFLNGIPIVPSDEDYRKRNVYGSTLPEGRFKIVGISSKSDNLIGGDDLKSLLRKMKELKNKIITSLPKDGNFVTVDVSPRFVIREKTIEWSFVIIGTEISNHGGEYEYSDDNYKACCYKAMLKGLQFICKNKIASNIIIKCENMDPFMGGKLSYENEARFANVMNFVKENNLTIDYKTDKQNFRLR